MALLEDVLAAVQHLKHQVEELPARLVHARQVIVGEGLSDISEKLGLIRAGEFRAGNNLEPGEGFSGVRMGFPGFFYPSTSTADSDHYNLAGVDADTLTFGIRSSDGAGVFGFGALTGGVTLERRGVVFGNGPTSGLIFENVNGLVGGSTSGAGIIYGDSHDFVIRNNEQSSGIQGAGSIILALVDSDAVESRSQFLVDVGTFRARWFVSDNLSGAELVLGAGAAFWAVATSDSAGYVDLKDGGSTLTAPSDAYGRLYTRDGNLRFISTDGVDYQLNTT